MHLIFVNGEHEGAPPLPGHICLGVEAPTQKGDVYLYFAYGTRQKSSVPSCTFGRGFAAYHRLPLISQYMVYRPADGKFTPHALNLYHSRRLPLP